MRKVKTKVVIRLDLYAHFPQLLLIYNTQDQRMAAVVERITRLQHLTVPVVELKGIRILGKCTMIICPEDPTDPHDLLGIATWVLAQLRPTHRVQLDTAFITRVKLWWMGRKLPTA